MTSEQLLEVNSLTIDYVLAGARMRALNRVSFEVDKGEVVGVAGESGCGKSTLGLALIGLLPEIADIGSGVINLQGQDLLKLSDQQMDRHIRGQKISMIFQNPQSALNQVFTVGRQMMDVLRIHDKYNNRKNQGKKSRKNRAIDLLRETGIAAPEERISNYPFEFSGGMKQRVMIAMALSSQTDLLIADEPTTALDVTIEAQILELLVELTGKQDTSILYISHNLGILSQISRKIIIMYAGNVFEMGPTSQVLTTPRHPYTYALVESLPSKHTHGERLTTIPGHVPSLDQLPPGCPFHPRCPFAEKECSIRVPIAEEVSPAHWSACLLDQKRGRQKWQWI